MPSDLVDSVSFVGVDSENFFYQILGAIRKANSNTVISLHYLPVKVGLIFVVFKGQVPAKHGKEYYAGRPNVNS